MHKRRTTLYSSAKKINEHRIRQNGRRPAASRQKARAGQKTPATPTGWRLWVFRSIAVFVVPAVFFGSIELGLRVFNYGYPPGPFVKVKANGRTCYGDNTQFSQRFFPRHLAREAIPYIFDADKPENTCRIFVLGASAAMGVPEPMFSFPRILRVMLMHQYPGTKFEIINTGMAAINSHSVLPIAREAAQHNPDLLVVYLGNNEVTGPYGAGTVFAPLVGNLSVIRATIAFKGTRLGQLLKNTFASVGTRANTPQMWRGLEMFLDKQIRANDPALQDVYDHFQHNLQDIIAAGRSGGANVILCTVGSNLKDNPPFGSQHRTDLTEAEKQQWDELYQQGIAYESTTRYAEAVERYLAAAKIDDSYADLQFRLGHCYWLMSEYGQAAERYAKAELFDTLRFRADTRINEIIRGVARSQDNIQFVDAVRIFEQNSPNRVPGVELFYEHVHLNFTGNYLLAQAILGEVAKTLGPHMQTSNPEPLSEAECARRLAYTEWDRYQIENKVLNKFIKRPPFSNQLYHNEQVAKMERQVAALKTSITNEVLTQAAQQNRWAIENDPSDWLLRWKYGQFLAEQTRDYHAAMEQFRWVQNHLPHSWLGHNSLATMLYALGDLDTAISTFKTAIRLKPTCGTAHFYLAEAYRRQGVIDMAADHYTAATQWERDCIPAYNNLARIMAERGQTEKAIETCRRGLIFSPNSATLRGSLGTLLARQGQRDEALKELRTALDLDPNSAAIRRSLQILLGGG
jgi:tetratricopeptide (TPR) repeat protein